MDVRSCVWFTGHPRCRHNSSKYNGEALFCVAFPAFSGWVWPEIAEIEPINLGNDLLFISKNLSIFDDTDTILSVLIHTHTHATNA